MTTKLAFVFALCAFGTSVLACSSSDSTPSSSGSTSSTSSSSGSSSNHSCADLLACCNKIMTTDATKQTCLDTYNMYKGTDSECDVRYDAFSSYCP